MEIDLFETKADEASLLLDAVANPKRLMVLCNLMNGEKPVHVLMGKVGMSQSALSQQLAKLRALRLVATRRDGQTIYYSLASANVERLLDTLYTIYCEPQGKCGA
jgi:DNA-binding transcriptional ArsR family regulator